MKEVLHISVECLIFLIQIAANLVLIPLRSSSSLKLALRIFLKSIVEDKGLFCSLYNQDFTIVLHKCGFVVVVFCKAIANNTRGPYFNSSLRRYNCSFNYSVEHSTHV